MTLLQDAHAKLTTFHKLPPDKRVPLTHGELDALLHEAINDSVHDTGHGWAPLDFTCYGCAAAATCEHAYDLYNTHGDCLASK